MSNEPSALPRASGENGASGAAKILLGFVIGAVAAFAPMYYFYMGPGAPLRSAPAGSDQTVPLLAGDSSASPGGPMKPFASRLTYELSQVPPEPVAVVVRAPVPPATVPPPPVSLPAPPATAPVMAAAESPAARVANARPINADPPQPRDRTRSIEQEAQKAEYREQPKPPAQAAPPQPRVIEGREVKLPDTPTRPIVAGAATNSRAEIESERNRLAAEVARAWPPGDSKGAKREPPTVIAIAPLTAAPPATKPSLESSPAPASKAAPQPDTGVPIVDARLAATREWLSGAPETTHTIQLMGSGSSEQLKTQLQSLSKVVDPSNIYVFRTRAGGKPSITVVYGAYPDKQSALQALEKLPSTLRANRPVLRTVNGIRVEMKQNKTDS